MNRILLAFLILITQLQNGYAMTLEEETIFLVKGGTVVREWNVKDYIPETVMGPTGPYTKAPPKLQGYLKPDQIVTSVFFDADKIFTLDDPGHFNFNVDHFKASEQESRRNGKWEVSFSASINDKEKYRPLNLFFRLPKDLEHLGANYLGMVCYTGIMAYRVNGEHLRINKNLLEFPIWCVRLVILNESLTPSSAATPVGAPCAGKTPGPSSVPTTTTSPSNGSTAAAKK